MKIYTVLRLLVTLSGFGALAACGSITAGGLIAASKLDPVNTPPGEISVALGVPKSLQLADGDAVLSMAFKSESSASTPQFEEFAALVIEASGANGPQASTEEEHVFVARISPADVPAIAAVQAKIKELRARGIDGEGSLSIHVVGGCYAGEIPERIAVSTWLRTDASAEFVQLTRRTDVEQFIGAHDAALLRTNLRPCRKG